jgi:hypothetical protein
MPAHLPREEMRLDFERQACCGGELHRIGETVSEVLDYVPARLRVIRICRPRYGCRACGTIHQAPAPERPIAKGLATPGLLAHVLVSKYCDHLPLYRQSQIFARHVSSWTARRSPTGLAAPPGGWSRCRRGSPNMSSLRKRCSPTTRRFPYSTPVAAAPRPAASGSTRVTISPGTGPTRRRRSISTVPIAGPSVPLPT